MHRRCLPSAPSIVQPFRPHWALSPSPFRNISSRQCTVQRKDSFSPKKLDRQLLQVKVHAIQASTKALSKGLRESDEELLAVLDLCSDEELESVHNALYGEFHFLITFKQPVIVHDYSYLRWNVWLSILVNSIAPVNYGSDGFRSMRP